jgi:uncharacterized membrane protein
MIVKEKVLAYFSLQRWLRLSLIIILTLVYRIGFVTLKTSLLPQWNVYQDIIALNGVKFDFFGAIIPLAISLFMILFLVRKYKFTVKKYLITVGLMMSLLIFSKPTEDAIIIFYDIPIVIIGLISSILATYEGNFVKRINISVVTQFKFASKNYMKSILISYSMGSIIPFLIDLLWLPCYSFSLIIGGAGLEDGIFLIGLNAVFISLLFNLFMESLFSKNIRIS